MCIEIAKLERITHTYNTYKWRFLVMTTTAHSKGDKSVWGIEKFSFVEFLCKIFASSIDFV